MRKILSLAVLLAIGFGSLQAQIFNPVKWSFSNKQVSATEFDLVFTAKIDDGWTVYSQFLESEDGPVATSFTYDKGTHFTKVGKTNEDETHRKKTYDKVFEMNLVKFTKEATFTQRVKISDFSKPVSGYLNYMTCNDERCLPPTDVDFSFTLKNAQSPTSKDVKNVEVPQNKTTTTAANKNTKETASTNKTAVPPTTSITPITPAQMQTDTRGVLQPVKWSVSSKQVNDTTYDLVFTATMDKGWNIYSQDTDPSGPVPTSFAFEEGTHYGRVDKVTETGKKKKGPDPLFNNVEVIKFIESPAVFTQRVEIIDGSIPIKGSLEFMTCDDEKCLPPTEVPFSLSIANNRLLIGDAAEEITSPLTTEAAVNGTYGIPMPDLGATLSNCGDEIAEEIEKVGIWRIFVLGFLGGLVALLTPCVFPMVPLTVSYFTKSSGNKSKGMTNAMMYGFFIFLVYLLLSVPFHLLDSINPDILNDISTNVWLNIAFFVIFLFFAFSFFGFYELTLPESLTNKVSSAEGVGGVLGIFFMALTLALVSFSCTGPILGSLLAGALSSDGGAMQLTAGMGGFGLALALPFAVFAAFPSLMSNLPKSGGWLNTVKVVLGFLELALALKFLSNADLVEHWGLLKIEPFLILWAIIFIGLGLYFLAKIKFPHDSPVKGLSWWRIGGALLSFGFSGYLVTGLFYNEPSKSLKPLTLLSGLAPPSCYSIMYPCDCPQNLNCFKDFETGLAYAKEKNLPVMIDFTGHACVNCRKMEEHVWPKQEVYSLIDKEFVLISLYVDDKRELEEVIEVEKPEGGTRKLRTIGNKWSHFQTTFFKANSQPYYVLISPDGTLLNAPVGYTPDVKEYANFLQCGLDAFNAQKK